MRGGSVLVLVGRTTLAVAMLAAILVGCLSWRLSAGPIALPSLARVIARAAGTPERRVSVGQVMVSWTGFARQDEPPLHLQARDVAIASPEGTAQIGQADLSLRLVPLLLGRIDPGTAALAQVRIMLAARPQPGPSGKLDPGGVLRAIAATRLRHLHVHDATIAAADVPQARVAALDIDLDRRDGGGIGGRAVARLQAADQSATLDLAAQLQPGGTGTEVQGSLSTLVPARLAETVPAAAPLAALDAPVTLAGSASLGPDLQLVHGRLDVGIGAGTIHAGTGTAPLLGADLRADLDPGQLVLRLVRLDTAADPAAQRTRFSGEATLTPHAPDFLARVRLDVDQVDFANLAALWPAGTGGPGTRPWMTANITAGRLTDGHADLDMTLLGDLSDVSLQRIDAAIDGHDVTCHWLRPVPPVEHAEARLTVTDPDVIDINVSAATQAGGSEGGLKYHDALIHLTGIAGRDQFADIRTGLDGKLPDLLAVLNHPRIKLLSKRPVAMRDARGDVAATVSVGHLPLRDDVQLDDLVIAATAHTAHVHLGGLVAGYDLDDGLLDLVASNDALSVTGTAALAGFASHLDIGMDFRTGPPDQVQENVVVRSTVEMDRMQTFGIDPGPALRGAASLDVHLQALRRGRTTIEVAGDLADLAVSEPRMALAKAAGTPGTAHATMLLDGDHVAAIDALRIKAPGIDVQGAATMIDGKPNGLSLQRLAIGTGTDLHGEIGFPGVAGRKLSVRLAGPSLDLAAALGDSGGGRAGRLGSTPWDADLSFDQVLLGGSRRLTGVRVTAAHDGTLLRHASIEGTAGAGAAFRASVTPETGGRRLLADAADTGALLRAADLTDSVAGGRLHVVGRWADTVPDRPLAGLFEMTDFRLRDAPTLARVLKALTVYGLVDLARGPGIGVTRLDAPFSWQNHVLTLSEARAFSPSLGVTAQGRLDLAQRTADMKGTVVPAYFFNSLLGRVPVLGKLFTAERGGGLFATAVTVRGPFDDLSVGVNPLSTLTPGFLRGVFGTNRPPQ